MYNLFIYFIFKSDSDDICSGVPSNISYNLMNMSTICRSIPNNMESDSLNENSPCRRSARRLNAFDLKLF